MSAQYKFKKVKNLVFVKNGSYSIFVKNKNKQKM